MERTQTSLEFGPRSRPKASEYVVEQLRREIALGLIPPGQALPPERDLADLLRVGRATVQAALTVLKEEGLVETRRGRSGGTFVTSALEVDAEVSESTRQRLRPMRGAFLEALAFRVEVEPIVCGLAAIFRTEADLAALHTAETATRSAEDDPTFMLHDAEFHSALANACHNRFYSDALLGVRNILEELLAALPESPMWHQRTHEEHAQILVAVTEHDHAAATRLMLEHAGATDVFAKALLNAL